MKVANTVDLKNKTNKLLRQVMRGEAVIVTYRGKPAASITPLSEEDLEDFVLEHSPKIRKMVAAAEGDRNASRVFPLAVGSRTAFKGVQFLSDVDGKKRAALIDIRRYRRVWEDLYDVLVAEARKGESRVPWEDVKKRLRARRARGA